MIINPKDHNHEKTAWFLKPYIVKSIRHLASHIFNMKFNTLEIPRGKYPPPNTHIKVLVLALTLSLLTVIPLCLNSSPSSPLSSPEKDIGSLKSIEQGKNNISGLKSTVPGKNCDVFRGNWVPYPNGTYYTNTSCSLIIDQQNCMKFGRPDTEFLKWRWKPDECELPFFGAVQFLELVRGKSLAFLGDSVGRNQMQSLLCLLSSVSTQVRHCSKRNCFAGFC